MPCAHREQLLPSPASPLLSLLGSALGISFVDFSCICTMGLSTMRLPVVVVLPSSLVSLNLLPFSLLEAAGCLVFPGISLHVSMPLLTFTEKITFLTGRHLAQSVRSLQSDVEPIREGREPGSGAWASRKAAHPGGIHLLGALGARCVQHNLICAWNINPGCCRHAAWGFTSSFVKTAFTPSTAAARSFPGNPIPAISEVCRGS